MEDQATQLRKLVEGKNINGQSDQPQIQPVPPVQPIPSLQQSQPEIQAVPPIQPVPPVQVPVIQSTMYQTSTSVRIPVYQMPPPKESRPTEQPAEHPSKDPEIVAAQMSAYSRGRARTIAITSGKGGVGKTSLAVNLAIAMGLEGKRVLIVDADLGMANVDILLGTTSGKNLMDLLKDDVSLEDVILHGPYGVSYISGGSGMEHAVDMTEEQRRRLFSKLMGCDEWADIILVDTGAGIGKTVLDFVAAADETILLTTSEPTAITDAYAMMKAYNRISKRNKMQVLVNRVYDEAESNEVMNNLSRAAQKFLQVQVSSLGYVCDDRAMLNSVRKQVPLLAANPNSVAAKCIRSVARSIINGKQEKVKLGWKGFLKKVLGFAR